jgi:pimeloyl-ACP methyl ester carboxylesterase
VSDIADIDVAVIPTARLQVCVRWVAGRDSGVPVVFVHGNVSSSPFFFRTMTAMPERYRPIAVDLRGFGGTETLPVDATRGVRDFADDLRATLEALGLSRAHLVGWSMGGGVVLQAAIDEVPRIASLTLINPVSPYGFGGTWGLEGAQVSPDGAGSGGGTANPAFVQALDDGVTTGDEENSPRSVLWSYYVAPGWDGDEEETYVASMLSTSIGEDNYPGDSTPSDTWPGMAPGARGVLNTMAPTHLNLTGIVDLSPKPPILWVRGELDQIVSDASAFDLAQLGALGVLPGYPGVDVIPPQPMVGQTRAVLERYAGRGGSYSEVVIPAVGHSPHIEDRDAFLDALIPFLDRAAGVSAG